MPYVTGRIIHDADSHLMETDRWLIDHADPTFRDRITPFDTGGGLGDGEGIDWAAVTCPLHQDPDYRAAEDQVLLRKNYHAAGSFERDHRPQALDQLGFASQLVFNTFASSALEAAEHGDDLDLAYAMADAHNRAMLHFCEVDPRLLAVGYVALADVDRAADQARRAIDDGVAALMIASSCPRTHSPSHIGLDRVWAQAQEARVPILMHVGGGGALLSPRYFDNGLPPVPDFHGGAENFRSVDYMAIPYPPMQTMATLILDGVLDRFPELRWGIIEQARRGCRDGCATSTQRSVRSARTRSGCRSSRRRRARSCGDRCASRRTRTRTSAGSSATRHPRSACSPRTTRTSRAAGTR